VSLFTKPREEKELVGLVYSLTEKPRDTSVVWYRRISTVGAAVLLLTIGLNIYFW
jgi:SSS family solute:Na+ symporter